MACTLSTGHTLDCKETIGGIDEIFVVDFETLYDGMTFAGSPEEITNLGTVTLFRYQAGKNTGSFTETVTSDVAQGTIFYNQVLEFTIFKLTSAMKDELHSLNKGRWLVFVRDNNDNIWLMGRLRGAEVTGGTAVTGGATGDLNGYTIQVTAEEKAPMVRVADAMMTTYPFDTPLSGVITVTPAYT